MNLQIAGRLNIRRNHCPVREILVAIIVKPDIIAFSTKSPLRIISFFISLEDLFWTHVHDEHDEYDYMYDYMYDYKFWGKKRLGFGTRT